MTDTTNKNWPEVGKTFLGPQSVKMRVIDVWEDGDETWVKYINPTNNQDYSCLLEAFNSRYGTNPTAEPVPYNIDDIVAQYK